MVPGIGMSVACGNTRKSAVLTVSGSTCLLNCNWITLLVGTPPALFAGLTVLTDGVVVSAAVPVVKVKLLGLVSGFSATSVIWFVAAIIYTVPGLSGTTGVNVTNVFPLDSAIAPGTGLPPCNTWKPVVALITLKGSLNWATTREFSGTPVAAFAGLTANTAGPSATGPKPGGNSQELDW